MRRSWEIRRLLARTTTKKGKKKKKKQQFGSILLPGKKKKKKPFPSVFCFQFNVSLVSFPGSFYFANVQVSSSSGTSFYARDKQEILFFLLSITSPQASPYFFSFLPLSVSNTFTLPHRLISHAFFFSVLLHSSSFLVPF